MTTMYESVMKDVERNAKKAAEQGNNECEYFCGMLTGAMFVAAEDNNVSILEYEKLAELESEVRHNIFMVFDTLGR